MFNGLWNLLYDLWLPILYFSISAVTILLFIGFVLKKKRTGVVATLIMAALMITSGIMYCIPHNIIDTGVEVIYKIKIAETTITDKETIKMILDDLNSSQYKRTLTSGIGGHSEYSVRGYDESGKLMFHIEIADEQTVDTGLFWEKCVGGKLNLSLYQDAILQNGDKQD